jgi:MATE family multidrug resistance protein
MQSDPHPFLRKPHQTLIQLSIPVLLSFIAEPVTALVDTAFISSLGVIPLAALGVGTSSLSSMYWMFNFLAVGAQTEIAQLHGKGEDQGSSIILSTVLLFSLLAGVLLIAVVTPTADWIAGALGAAGEVQGQAASYIRLRLLGAPAVLIILTASGAMRGIQDMRTPLWIALGVNGMNILLDWALVFGLGPVPALGVEGSALASTASQWTGAVIIILLVNRKIKLSRELHLAQTLRVLQIGGDMFIRTGMLNLFLLYSTRVANQISPDAGAAHQVLRQLWVFSALALDAFASSVQSLVGFFIGRESVSQAKQVIRVALTWSLGTGSALGILMYLGRDIVAQFLVPASAVTVFLPAWLVSSLSQPINSIAFLTDGVHLGTGDYRFLRNAVLAASLIGLIGLWLVERSVNSTLSWTWFVIGIWISLRGLLGLLRIWPGIGNSVFRQKSGN